MRAVNNIWKVAFLATTLIGTNTVSGVSAAPVKVAEADAKIAKLLAKLDDVYSKGQNADAIGQVSNELEEYVTSCAKTPAMLTTSMERSEKAGMAVNTSADKLLRVYSWDTDTGGSMHFFDTIVQFRTLKGFGSKSLSPTEPGDGGVFYNQLVQVQTKGNKAVYLLFGYGVGSHIDQTACVSAYSIVGGALKKTAIFSTPKKDYDEISCWTTDGTYAPITFKNGNKTMLVPIVSKDGHATSKSLVYKFDGNKFVFQK